MFNISTTAYYLKIYYNLYSLSKNFNKKLTILWWNINVKEQIIQLK